MAKTIANLFKEHYGPEFERLKDRPKDPVYEKAAKAYAGIQRFCDKLLREMTGKKNPTFRDVMECYHGPLKDKEKK